jgi:predicted DNA-binding transcriptional regulator AlpA
MKCAKKLPVAEKLLLLEAECASLCGVGRNTWRNLNDSGRCPRPLHVAGRIRRWRRSEIESWIQAGMPTRSVWEARQADAG